MSPNARRISAMEPSVVDTDVVSYFFKNDSRLELYAPMLAGRLRIVSFMTVAELLFWAESSDWGDARRRRLEAHLSRFIVIESSPDLARTWATVRASARRAGRTIGVADAWMAATAIHYGLPLVTNNADDYARGTGLRLLTV